MVGLCEGGNEPEGSLKAISTSMEDAGTAAKRVEQADNGLVAFAGPSNAPRSSSICDVVQKGPELSPRQILRFF
ncbi:hypothetical protein ANN_18625 [Periplaneta americana]|uniref:Per a allergen n=1 Tax=Periplaneta americana TaxID=6978 RepID=A0ABQ8SP97_PERAM|nr:hypothetical protein ANN_18625 [Periplaneta americana]